MKKFLFLTAALILSLNSATFAEEQFVTEAETAFKKIGLRWLKFEEQASRDGMAPEWTAVQLKQIREDFKTFAAENHDSPWADDAYFFSAALESRSAKSLEEKIFLIDNYPQAEAEEWTQNSLSFALPGIEPLDAGVRMDVCLEYLKTGRQRDLEMLAVDSAEKYPELGTQFEILVLEPQNKTRQKTKK